MNKNDSDQQFHDNLSSLGSQGEMPGDAGADIRSKCASEFNQTVSQAVSQHTGRTNSFVRRPAIISTLSIAAAIALLVGFFYQPSGLPEVNAAMVLARLNDQVQQLSRIDITLQDVQIEEVAVDGRLQISKNAVAGDLRVQVTENEGEPPLEVDLVLGIKPGDGWVLIRKLVIPDPEASAILNFFMPPGTHMLLKLPADELDFGDDFDINMLKGEQITQVIQELIESASDVGATVTHQADGTVLLTLPIEDASTLEALARLKSISSVNGVHVGASLHGSHKAHIETMHEKHTEAMKAHGPHHEIIVNLVHGDDEDDESDTLDDDEFLYGITLQIVYDPAQELVRSLVIDNIGEANGRISVTLTGGEIDASLLDASLVMDEKTRVLDLDALQKTFGAFHKATNDSGDNGDADQEDE